MIKSTLACNLDRNILRASLPLFQEGEVEAMEWSFDSLMNQGSVPMWFIELVSTFSEGKGLVGHGVFFSLFNGHWSAAQQDWLDQLESVCKRFKFQHITEHFGFMTGENFHSGAPISVPLTKTTLALGQDRLKRISVASKVAVGLENLAFTYSLDDVKRQGEFLAKLVEPVNGFIILDLHNLYCQIHNFQIDFEEIIKYYDLALVREIHISGGSWEESSLGPGNKVRRDTHDNEVPEEVFELLRKVIPQCPNLAFVVMEQLGNGLKDKVAQEKYREDFKKMKFIVDKNSVNFPKKVGIPFFPKQKIELSEPIQSESLHREQMLISEIALEANTVEEAQQYLFDSNLANSEWRIEQWEPHMIETMLALAKKMEGQ